MNHVEAYTACQRLGLKPIWSTDHWSDYCYVSIECKELIELINKTQQGGIMRKKKVIKKEKEKYVLLKMADFDSLNQKIDQVIEKSVSNGATLHNMSGDLNVVLDRTIKKQGFWSRLCGRK